jgi:hypothetical protein
MTDRARCRMAYANMTPEQRDQRRKQQRLYNKAPFRKEAMKVAKKTLQGGAETHFKQ